jgi:3-phenylpropionate/trans-cinnamate dioxygenase ferredoxin reductase subunit
MTSSPSPSTSRYALLVIGSGPGGVSAAAAYVEAGGPGPVCLVSADLDDPYQRPPLSKAVLAGEEEPTGTPILEDDDALESVEVRLRTSVRHLDLESRTVTTEAGDVLGYDRLVVATGSDPVPLPGVDDDAEVFLLRSLDHGRRLASAVEHAQTAVVVGSGFIGCEAAAALAGRGVATTLVTPESAPQAKRLGDWAGGQIAGWLREAGVELRTGVQVERVEAPRRVHLDDGSSLDCDVVLAAVGVDQARPFLESSGLELEEGHLAVDGELLTSDPHVWAAGDVARAHHGVVARALAVEHWGDAITMGELAGRNAAGAGPDGTGEPAVWSDPPGFWSEIGEHTLKYSAWGDGHEGVEVVQHGNGAFTVWYADASGELVGVLTHDRDADYERGGELLSRRASLAEALAEAQGRPT